MAISSESLLPAYISLNDAIVLRKIFIIIIIIIITSCKLYIVKQKYWTDVYFFDIFESTDPFFLSS